MKRTGIFGGSFNPIHNGHISLARQLLDKCGLDEIWFVVSPQNPLKAESSLLADVKRLEMARAALKGESRMMASDYEFSLPRPSYTWDTLSAMRKDFPDREFVLLIGGDNWDRFNRWYHHDDIVNNFDIIVYPRKDSAITSSDLPPRVSLADTPLYNISSTEIRRRIAAGESFGDLVPDEVRDKIIREQLYLGKTKDKH